MIFLLKAISIIIFFALEGGASSEGVGDEKEKWNLVIYPPAGNQANVILKRVDDTLNLTCILHRNESLVFIENTTVFSTDEIAYDQLHKLSWYLPNNPQNSKNRVVLAESPNHTALTLTVINLKESDSGEYECKAKSMTDLMATSEGKGDFALSASVKITVKSKKGNCNPPLFLCPSGECLSRRFLCDGKVDCKDESDEKVPQCERPNPCEKKLRCEDGRCISPSWCCDRTIDPNCTVRVIPQCCRHLPFNSNDLSQYSAQPQPYNDMGFLQTTIYTVIGCAMAFMFIITIMVIAICRVHLKRSSLPRYPHHLSHLAQREDSWTNIFLHSGNFPCSASTSGASGLLVTYNINNGVQFMGRPMNPPPYSEIVGIPPREGPPPPYVSLENLVRSEEIPNGRIGEEEPTLLEPLILPITTNNSEESPAPEVIPILPQHDSN